MAGFLGHWCRLAAGTGIRVLQPLAGDATAIPNWWTHRISNGRMVGINNKIKAMLRLHYGLRNERFFILRLLGLHETKFRLSGC